MRTRQTRMNEHSRIRCSWNSILRILTFHDHPFWYHCFDLSWLESDGSGCDQVSDESASPHCPVIAHITVSSVRLCPSSEKADCCLAVRTVTVLHTFDVLHVVGQYFYSIGNKRPDRLCFSDNFMGLLLSFPEVYEIIGVFILWNGFRCSGRLSVQTNHEHRAIFPHTCCGKMQLHQCRVLGFAFMFYVMRSVYRTRVIVCVCVCVSSYTQIALCGKVLKTHHLPAQDAPANDARTWFFWIQNCTRCEQWYICEF